VGGQHYTPAALPGEEPVPVLQEAEWAPGPVWTGGKISFLTGFDTRTVQPVASGYTGYANAAHRTNKFES
jgi:hypothetical protein